MKVWIASLVFLGLACSKGPAQRAERASTRGSLVDVEAGPGAASAPVQQAEAQSTTTLTPDKVKAFVSYMEQFSALWKQWRADEQKRADGGARKDGAVAAPDPARAATLQTQLQGVRDKVGLTQPELETLQNLFTLVQANRNIKPATIDAKLAEFEQRLPTLPAPERAAAVQQLAEMRDMRANIVDMRDARRAYGDGVVDTMVAEWPTLSRLSQDL